MADIAAFAEEGFDPVAWINAHSKDKLGEDGLERYLSELEMRLQLAGEEIEGSLMDASTAALRRIPYAQQEVSRLRGDISALQNTTSSLAAAARSDAAAAASATAPLAALATVKGRMEGATDTLKEAMELSGAFRRVEEVFAAGDLPQVARLLAGMARSLSLVGEVPEFREGRQQLVALQERLSRQVEGRAAQALAQDDAAQVSALGSILMDAGRYSTFERLYCADRTARAMSCWEAATAAAAADAAAEGRASPAAGAAQPQPAAAADSGWLLSWCNLLLELLHHELAWLGRVMPGKQQQLLAALVVAVTQKVNKPLRAKLTTAAGSVRAIGLLLGDALVLARGLLELFPHASSSSSSSTTGSSSSSKGQTSGGAAAAAAAAPDADGQQGVAGVDVVALVRGVMEPLEEQVSRLGELEEARLTSQLATCLPSDPARTDLESCLSQLSRGLSTAFGGLRGAVESCLSLSGGTELRGLLTVVDRSTQQYLVRLQAAIGILLNRLSASDGSSSAPAPEQVALQLQLVVLVRGVSRHLGSLEALLRSTITTAIPRLTSAAAAGPTPGTPPDALAVRLLVFPEKLVPLGKLLARCCETRYVALPSATAACDALTTSTAGTVYTALLAPVSAGLNGLPTAMDWGAGSAAAGGGQGQSALGLSMPAFNAYPLACVTAVGEYLMTLPQQLEALIVEEGAGSAGEDHAAAAGGWEGDDELATEWLDKVAHGAALLYVDTVLALPALGAGGAAQLAADTEYIANVLSALAVAAPAPLLTLQLFAALPAEQWGEVAAAALADGSADGRVLKTVAAQRGLNWQPGSAAQHAAVGPTGGEAAAGEPAAAAVVDAGPAAAVAGT